jgi:maleate cis-trans isomerase
MYGWRARIGLVVPATNAVAEQEYGKLCGSYEGLAAFAARVALPPGMSSREWELQYGEGCLDAAERLAAMDPNILVLANTSGTLMCDDQQISTRIEDALGLPVISVIRAVTQSLERLSVRRVGLVTPYKQEFNQEFLNYFKMSGFEVIDFQTQGTSDILTIGRNYPDAAYSLAKQLEGDFEGVFISCTDFRSVEIIPVLERDLGVPVISSNLASFSEALLALGIQEAVRSCGILLSRNY